MLPEAGFFAPATARDSGKPSRAPEPSRSPSSLPRTVVPGRHAPKPAGRGPENESRVACGLWGPPGRNYRPINAGRRNGPPGPRGRLLRRGMPEQGHSACVRSFDATGGKAIRRAGCARMPSATHRRQQHVGISEPAKAGALRRLFSARRPSVPAVVEKHQPPPRQEIFRFPPRPET